MPSQVTNYQCPACTGPLHFSSGTGKLECEYCGSSYTVAEVEALFEEENRKAQAAAARAAESAADSEWGEDAAHMRSYNCPSCGANLICDETTAATSCPYCGNPSVIPGQFTGTKKPDYVIPFRQDKEAAMAALKRHYKGKPLLPKTFANENHLQEIKGVYVPFWLFDAKAEADVTFKTTRSHSHRSGNDMVTTTEHFEVGRAGSVEFRRIPVDGASKMPDNHMDSIEPFDYEELKPFAMSYLPGFLADQYDEGEETCAERADARCRDSAVQAMRNTVTGYDTCVAMREDVQLEHTGVKCALLPVWLLSTRWKDQNYLFAMNGQTGRFIGDLPISWGKFWLFFAGIFLLAGLLGSVFFPVEGAILGGALIAGLVCLVMAGMMKSARRQQDADAYIQSGSVNLTKRYDRFIHRTVTRQRIENNKPRGGPH